MAAKNGPDACGAGKLEAKVCDERVIGECPSCGATLSIGLVHSHAVLLHPFPFCDYFGHSDAHRVIRDMERKLS